MTLMGLKFEGVVVLKDWLFFFENIQIKNVLLVLKNNKRFD